MGFETVEINLVLVEIRNLDFLGHGKSMLKNVLSKINFVSKMFFGTKNFLVQKKLGQKHCRFKKFLVQKDFGEKKLG